MWQEKKKIERNVVPIILGKTRIITCYTEFNNQSKNKQQTIFFLWWKLRKLNRNDLILYVLIRITQISIYFTEIQFRKNRKSWFMLPQEFINQLPSCLFNILMSLPQLLIFTLLHDKITCLYNVLYKNVYLKTRY